MTEENSKKEISTFDYSIKVMNNLAGATLTQHWDYVFTYKRSIKLPQGEGCLGYPRPYNWGLT